MTDNNKKWSRVTNRSEYMRIAEELMGEPKYEKPGPSAISTPELVRTIRQTETVTSNLLGKQKVTSDFCQGFFTAMAAIRHDFGIRDESHTTITVTDGGTDDANNGEENPNYKPTSEITSTVELVERSRDKEEIIGLLTEANGRKMTISEVADDMDMIRSRSMFLLRELGEDGLIEYEGGRGAKKKYWIPNEEHGDNNE